MDTHMSDAGSLSSGSSDAVLLDDYYPDLFYTDRQINQPTMSPPRQEVVAQHHISNQMFPLSGHGDVNKLMQNKPETQLNEDIDMDVDMDVDKYFDMDEYFDMDKYLAENITDDNRTVESLDLSSLTLVSNVTALDPANEKPVSKSQVNPVPTPQNNPPVSANFLENTSSTSSLTEVSNITALDPDYVKPPVVSKKGAAKHVCQPFERLRQNEERDGRVRRVQREERMKKWLDGINTEE
jgi:hypothetical protein